MAREKGKPFMNLLKGPNTRFAEKFQSWIYGKYYQEQKLKFVIWNCSKL